MAEKPPVGAEITVHYDSGNVTTSATVSHDREWNISRRINRRERVADDEFVIQTGDGDDALRKQDASDAWQDDSGQWHVQH